jgi:hypothetical protein
MPDSRREEARATGGQLVDVRFDRAAENQSALTQGRFDHHDVAAPDGGAGRERHAGALRSHHHLHHNRDRRLAGSPAEPRAAR